MLELVDELWDDPDNPAPDTEQELKTIENHLEELLWQFSSDSGAVVVLLFDDPNVDRKKRTEAVLKTVLGAPRPSDDDDEYARSVAKFPVSYMSNAKWRKALTVLNEGFKRPVPATWKFINSDREFFWRLPSVDNLLESRLRDGSFEPIEYRWIQWICIPATAIEGSRQQELEAVRAALARAGKFQLQHDDMGLTLFGYGSPIISDSSSKTENPTRQTT